MLDPYFRATTSSKQSLHSVLRHLYIGRQCTLYERAEFLHWATVNYSQQALQVHGTNTDTADVEQPDHCALLATISTCCVFRARAPNMSTVCHVSLCWLHVANLNSVLGSDIPKKLTLHSAVIRTRRSVYFSWWSSVHNMHRLQTSDRFHDRENVSFTQLYTFLTTCAVWPYIQS